MINDAESLLDAFRRDGRDVQPFERMLEIVGRDGTQAEQLVRLAIRQLDEHATFIDAAISFIPEPALALVAREAVDALERDRANPIAESVIAYISLQRPDALQPYLARLFFELKPNAATYYAEWPWRAATDNDVCDLLGYLAKAESSDERARAAFCIYESRNWRRITEALAILKDDDLLGRPDAHLRLVGREPTGRVLYVDEVLHLRFPEPYLSQIPRPAWLNRTNDPTWRLDPAAGEYRFGGRSEGPCGVCGQTLHNLLALDPVPEGLEVRSVSRLDLCTCLSCLGWSEPVLAFKHGPDGAVIALDSRRSEPEFPAQPLAAARVQLTRTPSRWKWQDWALSNGRQNLNRVGGHPSWIQGADYPACPKCDRTMLFLMQLDSELPSDSGEEWLWGSGGICYSFWCDPCAVSATLWQCT